MTPEMRFAAYRAVAWRWREQTITSSDLSEQLGINATQVRRDLSTLGRHGKRGIGYRPEALFELLSKALEGAEDAVRKEALHQRAVADLVLKSEGV
jgi:NADH/NAD ratio-sensing transcriptional regulator Rex